MSAAEAWGDIANGQGEARRNLHASPTEHSWLVRFLGRDVAM